MRAVDTDALEIFRRSKVHQQTLGFAGGALDDRNLRFKRLIQFGFDVNGAEAQRQRIRSAQRERDRKRQLQRSFHLGKPPKAQIKYVSRELLETGL